MEKEYKSEEMMFTPCRMPAEKALNAIPGVEATVTREPPVAHVKFTDAEVPVETLKKAIEEAGYKLVE